MHRTLNLDDLIAQKAKKDVEKDPEMTNESLYDLIIPPGQLYQSSMISWKNLILNL